MEIDGRLLLIAFGLLFAVIFGMAFAIYDGYTLHSVGAPGTTTELGDTIRVYLDSTNHTDCWDIQFINQNMQEVKGTYVDGCGTPFTLYYVKVGEITNEEMTHIFHKWGNGDVLPTPTSEPTIEPVINDTCIDNGTECRL